MPRRDRTGPMGEGPMTGWGMGPCGRGMGRRFGRGRGFGRGFGFRRFYEPYPRTQITKEEETKMLEDEIKFLQEETESLKKRIKELKGE